MFAVRAGELPGKECFSWIFVRAAKKYRLR